MSDTKFDRDSHAYKTSKTAKNQGARKGSIDNPAAYEDADKYFMHFERKTEDPEAEGWVRPFVTIGG